MTITVEYLSFVGEVERRHRNVLQEDILPYIHLGPVGDREHTEVFAHILSAVEDVPEFWALVLRIPLSELVTMTEEASLVDAFLHAAHDEFGSEFLRQFITILDGFLEVMSRVDVEQRE